MKKIALTQKQVALVDSCDFERLNQFKWYANKLGNTFYAMRNSSRITGKRHSILMHHEVIGRPPKGLMIDHRNRQGTDNRQENLRLVTHRQNCQNQKKQKTEKTSRYTGVCWHKEKERWMAQIQINKKIKYLGYFKNEKDAFRAYKKAVNELGEKMLGE